MLDLEGTVADYWPEFAAEGKGGLTLRELLAHRSGAIGAAGGFSGLDLYMGLPDSLEQRFLPAQPMAITAEQAAKLEAAFPGPDSLLAVAFNMNTTPPLDLAEFVNIRKVRALGQASAGGVGNAWGLAGMYAAAIGEFQGRPPLLEPKTIAEFAKVHSSGIDMVTAEDHGFGLGFQAQGLRYHFLGADAFGHSGAAGAQGFADPSTGVAYGYVRRRFHYPPGGGAVENDRLAAAVIRAAS